MDSLDEKLMMLLGKNARQSSDALAKQLRVTAATVRRRMRILLQKDVLHIVGIIDPKKIGLPLAVVMAFDVAHENLESFLEMLADRTEIKWVSTTTGRFDVITIARFRSTEELSEFMRKEIGHTKGLRGSETFVCLDVKKGSYSPFTTVR